MIEIEAGALPRVDFLQRDDVGAQLADDRSDARRLMTPIPSDAAVDV